MLYLAKLKVVADSSPEVAFDWLDRVKPSQSLCNIHTTYHYVCCLLLAHLASHVSLIVLYYCCAYLFRLKLWFLTLMSAISLCS